MWNELNLSAVDNVHFSSDNCQATRIYENSRAASGTENQKSAWKDIQTLERSFDISQMVDALTMPEILELW